MKRLTWWVPAAAVVLALAALIGAACGDRSDGRSARPQATVGASDTSAIPKIDVHVHVDPASASTAARMLAQQGVRIAINASGGLPGPMLEASAAAAAATGGRLRFYCSLDFRKLALPDFADIARRELQACRATGAIGLKISKALGLGYINPDGSLVPVDDPRLDPVFAAAGELHLPVLIHSGDPRAFFDPPTPDNERHDELAAHPDWSFFGARPDGGGTWPSWDAILGQFERRVARHPGTTFVGAHFGNAPEDLERVGRMLDRFPHLVVETGARVPEIGRHPADRVRRFFQRYQDRILFGTDLAVGPWGVVLGSSGAEPDRAEGVPEFFASHTRFFETAGRGMRHPTPIQGRWTIDGIALPRPILEKLYHRNAARVFGLTLDSSPERP